MARRLRLKGWWVQSTLVLFVAFALYGADGDVSELDDSGSVPEEILISRSASKPSDSVPRRLPPLPDTSNLEAPPGAGEAVCPEAGCIRIEALSSTLLASAGALFPMLPVDPSLLPSIAIGAGSRDNENIGLWLRGDSDHVTLGDVAQFDLTRFTLEIWFKWSGGGETASSGVYGVAAYPLIAKGGPGGERVNYFLGIDPLSQVLVADFQEHASGERPGTAQWIGLLLALAGLVYLVSPGLSAPSAAGSALMAVAGIAWGFYSLPGRKSREPLLDTAGNFIRSMPFILVVSLFLLRDLQLSLEGAALAVASGALASGVGYVAWYAALKSLSATQAATVQLSVPVLAALGGVVFLAEDVSLRLVFSAIMILTGVHLAVKEK